MKCRKVDRQTEILNIEGQRRMIQHFYGMLANTGGKSLMLVLNNQAWRNLGSKVVNQNNASGSAKRTLSLQPYENDKSSLFMWTETLISTPLTAKVVLCGGKNCPSGSGTMLNALHILHHLILLKTLRNITPCLLNEKTINWRCNTTGKRNRWNLNSMTWASNHFPILLFKVKILVLIIIVYWSYYKNKAKSPDQCGSVGWASSHKTKHRQFDSWSGHMPGFGFGPQCCGEGVWQPTDPCFSLTLMFFSLSFSLPSPLSKNK